MRVDQWPTLGCVDLSDPARLDLYAPWSLPTMRVDKENCVVLGICMVVWGVCQGPQGPRWLIYTPMAWMKWVEKRIGVIGNFGAGGQVCTHPESG